MPVETVTGETETSFNEETSQTEETTTAKDDKEDNEETTTAKDKKKGAKKAGAQGCDVTSTSPHFDIIWLDGLKTSTVTSTGKKAYNTTEDKRDKLVDVPTQDTSNANEHYVSAQVHFSVGRTGYPIPAGQIQIKLPRYIFTEWDWDGDGVQNLYKGSEPNVGVKKKPSTDSKNFWWYPCDADGNEDSSGEYIMIENSADLNELKESPIDFTCMINYAYKPSRIDETKTATVKAEYNILDDRYCLAIENDKLTANIQTGTELRSVSKSEYTDSTGKRHHYDSWQEEWGDKPSNLSGDYYYIVYQVSATIGGVENADGSRNGPTQPYILTLSDKPGAKISDGTDGKNRGTVVATGPWTYSTYPSVSSIKAGTISKTEVNPGSANTTTGDVRGYYTVNPDINSGTSGISTYFSSGSDTFKSLVVVAYKNPDEIPSGEYVTNEVTVYKTPYSSSDKKESDKDDTKTQKRDLGFNYTGDLYRVRKYDYNYNSDMDVDNAKFLLERGQDAPLIRYHLQPYARGFGLSQGGTLQGYDNRTIVVSTNPNDYGKRTYAVEVVDDQLYLEGELLQPGDYQVLRTYWSYPNGSSYSRIYMNGNDTGREIIWDADAQDYKIATGDEITKADIYYRTSETSDWILFASGVEPGSANAVSGFPSNAYQTKWVWNTKAVSISPDIYYYVALRPTDHVLDLIDGVAEPTVLNVTGLAVRDYLGRIWNDSDIDSISGTETDKIAAHDQKGYGKGKVTDGFLDAGRYMQHDAATQNLLDLEMETWFNKKENSSSARDDRDNQISYRTYNLISNQMLYVYTGEPNEMLNLLEQAGLEHGQKEIIFYDLLPEGATVDAENIKATYYERKDDNENNGTAYYDYDSSTYFDTSTSVQGVIGNIQQIDNFHNSNRTLVVIPVSFPDGQASDWGQKYNSSNGLLQLGTRVRVSVPVVYTWDSLAMYGETDEKTNNLIQVNYAAVEVPHSEDGSPDDLSHEDKGTELVPDEMKDILKNLHDADGKESTGDDTYYGRDQSTFNIATSGLTGYTKTIKSSIESTYRTNSAEVASGQYSYQLRFSIENSTEAKNIIIYDVLEDAFIDDVYMEVEDHKEKYENAGKRYWRGTFDHVNTAATEKLGAKVVTYYSTVDRDTLQKGLDDIKNSDSIYADLTNTDIWTTTEPADKSTITAVAFDVTKKEDGSDFILTSSEDGTNTLLLYIYMNAPDSDEIQNGWDGKGSYMDPFVYAFNNSFLSLQTKSSASSTWGNRGARMSDGTTIRVAEPNPPIYKTVEDADEKAGDTIDDHEDNPDSVTLDDRDEVFKYSIESRIPTLGNDVTGEVEKNTFSIQDKLEDVLEFTKKDQIKVEIGSPNDDAYFVFDPEGQYEDESGNKHKGYLRVWRGDYDEDNITKINIEEAWFDSLPTYSSYSPYGFAVSINGGSSDSSSYDGNNQLAFTLSYNSGSNYDRVNEFSGEKVKVEFYAKVRDGVSLGAYESRKVPNQAKYVIPNHQDGISNIVYVTPPDKPVPNPKKTIERVEEDGSVTTEDQKFYVVVKNADGTVSNKLDDEGSPVVVTVEFDSDGKRILKDAEGNEIALGQGEEIKTKQQLENEKQKVHYTINGTIPNDAKSFSLSDKVANVLDIDKDSIKFTFTGTAKVKKFDEYGQLIDADGDGVWDTEEKSFERELTAAELEFITGKDYGMIYSQEGQNISVKFDEQFINRYGDYIIGSTGSQESETTVTDDEGNETTVTAITSLIAGDYGRTTRNTARDFAVGGFDVTIEFDAQIKDGADLSDYASELGYEIPNTANYQFGDNPEQDTETVTITPPPEDIFKRVNGKNHEDLMTMNEVFNYSINTLIPESPVEDADGNEQTVTSFKVKDALEKVLEFKTVSSDDSGAKSIDSMSVKIILQDGTVRKTLTADEIAKGLTVDDTEGANKFEFELGAALADSDKNLKDFVTGDYRLLITFDAHIKDGTTDSDLENYKEETAAKVPNKAFYQINNMDDVESNTVTVTPPPIGKTVNGESNYQLGGLDEVFEYKIDTRLPKDDKNEVETFTISDDLVNVLEIVDKNKIKAEIDGEDVTADADITTEVDENDNHHIKWVVDKDTLQANKEKTVILTFYAKIKDGADLSRYLQRADSGIPNEAKYTISIPDEPDQSVTSKPVTVTPPPIGKLVNDKKHENLKTESEVFKYTVSVLVPSSPMTNPTTQENETVSKFKVTDELVPELEFADKDNVSVKLAGTEYKGDANIATIGTLTMDTKEGKDTITFDLNEDLIASNARQYLVITFYAKIKDGADLEEYEDATGVPLVPNVARYVINDNPDWYQESNPVTVTPPDVEKEVNGSTHADLGSLAEIFEYTISGKVPKSVKDDPATDDVDETVKVTKFALKDILEPVLEFDLDSVDTWKVLVDGEEDESLLQYVVRDEVKAENADAGSEDDADTGSDENENAGSDENADTGSDEEQEESDPQYVLTFEIPEDIVNDYADKKISIVFTAKIKAGADLSSYYSSDSGEIEIPNDAIKTVKVNDNPEVETKSQPVTITPPPIDKLVNGKDKEELGTPDEEFTYSITTIIPMADKASSFKIKDKLEAVLEYLPAGKKITIGGQDVTAELGNNMILNRTANEVVLTLNQAMVEKYGGNSITVEFKAKIKDGADLTKYRVKIEDEEGNTSEETQIPNKARYQIDNKKEVSSEPVVVVPPEVGKSVNDVKTLTLKNINEVFTYKISGYIPANTADNEVTKAELSDTLKDVLEFTENEETVVKINGKVIEDAEVTRDGQKLVFDMLPYVATNAGQLVTVEFKAKFLDGTTLEDLKDYVNDAARAEVENETVLTVKIGDEPETETKSKPVTVTPPPIEKDVNGKEHEDLAVTDEVFTYNIRAFVPITDTKKNAVTEYKIMDTIEDVLEFTEDDVIVKIGDKELSADEIAEQVVIEEQTITVSLTEDQIAAFPKSLVSVSFKAKVKDGADLSSYITDEGDVEIPNKARYKINDDSDVESNVVTITPPDVGKTVNDKVNVTLEGLDEVFTYKISGRIPVADEENPLINFTLSDTIESVLEFVDVPKTVTLGEKDFDVVTEENVLSVTIDDAEVLAENAGSDIIISFTAKISEGADLSEYITIDNNPEIPNEAVGTATFADGTTTTSKSKPVTVTPPPIEKRVNGKHHEGLAADDEIFTYSVHTYVPTGDDVIKFVVEDTIENVLEFSDESEPYVAVGGEALEGADVKISGQTITLTLTEEQIKEHVKQALVLTFKAKIKDGADLTPYITDGLPLIPNKAKFTINDDPDRSHESNEVTVTPPTLDKKVNGSERAELKERRETFTYTIDTIIPNDATELKFTDVLEDVLEFKGASSDVKVTIDGTECESEVGISGQTLTVTVKEAALKDNGGKRLAVEFDAAVKLNADLEPYTNREIPNKAVLVVNNDASRTYETKPVIVVPPDGKNPPIEKTVNDKEHEDLASNAEVFTYSVITMVPEDAKKFVVRDTLEKVLEFTGMASVDVTIGDEALAADVVSQIVEIKDNKITLTLKDDMAVNNRESKLVLSFDAKVKDGADLSKYKKDGKISIPNTAEYEINDNPFRIKKSNTVTVTPPGDTGNPPDSDPPTKDNEPTKKPDNPGNGKKITSSRIKTGDETNTLLWIILVIAAAAAATGAITVRKRRGSK